ncbi:MAG: hypothetical protein LBT81_01165 [Helicobacteraceae bacterium]|jgi:hypothetical protein|nr:hypothetical protein [Helicobacteraceae bacterium]
MKSTLVVFLLLGFGGGGGFAVASVETISQDDIVNLSGTKWSLTYVVAENKKYDIEFKEGGVFWYSEPIDTTPDNDFWEQNGEIVKISINDGYAKFEGRFISKDLIKGTAKNADESWAFEIRRGERREPPADIVNLSGTKWMLTDIMSDGDREYFDTEFKEGGAFWYSEPNDTTPDNDFWEQNGEIVKISINDGYAKFEGRFISKDLIKGTAKNKVMSWEFEMRRGERTAPFPAQH